VKGKRHGYGEYFWTDIDRYKGNWVEGNKHGRGERYYPDGAVSKGSFENNLEHGYCECYWADGSYYKGYWIDGLRHGRGINFSKKQGYFNGTFENGTFLKPPEKFTEEWICKNLLPGIFVAKVIKEGDYSFWLNFLPTRSLDFQFLPMIYS
jgi:hypothetical protein